MEYVTNDQVAKKHQKELPRLKKSVEEAHKYFKHNYDRFNKFRSFVFESSISDKMRSVNESKDWPIVEFNICNAYVSRLAGEFSKQEPSIEVMSADGEQADKRIIETAEGHYRHILDEADQDGVQYQAYRDSISGGFSVLEVVTEYAHDKSFDQVIKVKKEKYPTMCGFDPMATLPHKGDGKYSFKIVPMRKEDFKNEYPKYDIDDLRFIKTEAGFNWSFNNGVDDIVLVCVYFEKKYIKTKIVKLVNGSVMTQDEYEDFLEEWKINPTNIEQPPAIYGDPRVTNIDCIYRYTFIENQMLSCEKTDFKYLPQIFVDGDSIDLFQSNNGTIKQFTKPYVYHAEGAQNLKNLSTQSLMNHLENQVAHKFIVKKEAIPDEKAYQNALTNVQKAQTLVVNAYMDNDPNKPIPDPISPVPLVPAPPEVLQGIQMSDSIMQTVLGSYDASLGINDNQLSGVAIIEGATQSNATAMPYVENYLTALSQVGQIVLDLIPKYYKTPRTIPIMNKRGERSFVRINDPQHPQSVDINYDSNALQIKVKAGVNFAIQKARALQQIVAMMQASQSFSAFMNSKGLPVLLDNIEIRGVDILKEMAEEWKQEQEKAQAQQQQMAQQSMMMNPQMIKAQNEKMEIQRKSQQDQVTNFYRGQELQLQQAEMARKQQDSVLMANAEMNKSEAEKIRAFADMSIKASDMSHRHTKEHLELAHKVDMDHKGHKLSVEHANQAKEDKNEQSNPVE